MTSSAGGFGNVIAENNLDVSGTSILRGGVVLTGSASVSTLLDVSGATTFRSSVTVPSANLLLAGSQFGLVIPVPASTIITGGQWASFVSGTNTTIAAATAATVNPFGICTTTVASGGTANILVRGVFAMIAEGTIAIGDRVSIGAASSLTTVLALGSATSMQGNAVGKALNTSASGTTATVLVAIGL